MRPGLTLEDLRDVQRRYPVDQADVRTALARVPASWELIGRSRDGGAFRRGGVQVLLSVEKMDDGNLWIHVSLCGRTGFSKYNLPTWDDIKRVKHDFVGADRWAYQVFPDEREYVNDNPYVLHLFSRFDGTRALPDFTRGLGTL